MSDLAGFLSVLFFGVLIGFVNGANYKVGKIAKEKVFIDDNSKYECKMVNTLKDK